MKKIYKYSILPLKTTLSIPAGAKILSMQLQNALPVIWVEANIDVSIPNEDRYFKVLGTGFEVDENCKAFIGTFQMLDGTFVGHLYELYA